MDPSRARRPAIGCFGSPGLALRSLVVFLSLLLALCVASCPFPNYDPPGIADRAYPIQSPEREALAREYSLAHYWVDGSALIDPSMIIMHWTSVDRIESTLKTFAPARIDPSKPDLVAGGLLNVGVHYMVDRDGTIWALLPEEAMGRHAAGFNHRALGIEMVGAGAASLTAAQLDAASRLVADILSRHPPIAYLLGHFEYIDPALPHYSQYLELQAGYLPSPKPDPGPAFMASLRERLALDYSITLAK